MKENNCPIEDNEAYLTDRALGAESAIFSRGCGGFSPLEQHPPGSFVRCVEKPAKGAVLCRIELPQVEGPLLAGENPADEHDLDHVGKLELLVHWGLESGLESGQLLRTTPQQALLIPGSEPHGDAISQFGDRCPFRSRGSVM